MTLEHKILRKIGKELQKQRLAHNQDLSKVEKHTGINQKIIQQVENGKLLNWELCIFLLSHYHLQVKVSLIHKLAE